MHVPVALLRFMAGAISLAAAHFLGRDIAQRRSPLRWALRYVLSIAALCYLGFDGLAVLFLCAGAALFALGWWAERHRKPQEDLTKKIFGEDDERV